MATVHLLRFVWGIFDHPRRVLGSFYHCVIVIIDGVVLIIWTFQYLVRLAGKRLFTPQNWGFRLFDPLNGLRYQRKPKRHTLAWIRIIWAINCESLTSGYEFSENPFYFNLLFSISVRKLVIVTVCYTDPSDPWCNSDQGYRSESDWSWRLQERVVL